MSDALERRYARLLAVYPADYRRSRGAEVLGTLLDSAGPDQTRPSLRETAALLLGALRVRADAARRRTAGQTWLPTLRAAALMLLVSEAAVNAIQATERLTHEDFAFGVLSLASPEYLPIMVLGLAVGALIAVVRHRYRAAVAVAVAGSAVVSFAGLPVGAFGYSPLRLPLAVLLLLPMLRRNHVTTSGVLKYLPALPLLLLTVTLFAADAGAAAIPIQLSVLVGVCLASLAWSAIDERVTLALGLLLLEHILSAISIAYHFPANGFVPILVSAVAPTILLAVGAAMARRQARL